MQRSTDRILTTHVGSLIRPDELLTYIRPLQAGEPYDMAAHADCLKSSVGNIVRQQAAAGIDVVSDGEFVEAGQKVKIVEKAGLRIVVVPTTDEDQNKEDLA